MDNIFSTSYILLSLFLSLLFLLLCYIVGQQFLEGQNSSFGLGQYHVTSVKCVSPSYDMEAETGFMYAKIFKSTTTIARFQNVFAQICKLFYSIIFTLGCLIFVLIIQDINRPTNSGDVDGFMTLSSADRWCWSWVMSFFSFTVTYVLPFLLVFGATAKRFQVYLPCKHRHGLVVGQCLALCVSFLAVIAEQLLLGLGSGNQAVAAAASGSSSGSSSSGVWEVEAWGRVERLRIVLFFGLSEEGLRASVALLALPGVTVAAFVAAYAAVSLSVPVLVAAAAGFLRHRQYRHRHRCRLPCAPPPAMQREVTLTLTLTLTPLLHFVYCMYCIAESPADAGAGHRGEEEGPPPAAAVCRARFEEEAGLHPAPRQAARTLRRPDREAVSGDRQGAPRTTR